MSEKDNLIQPTADRGLPQCDQLHAADAKNPELQLANRVANTILYRLYADPDSDLSVLARQFLRSREAITAIRSRAIVDEALAASRTPPEKIT